MDKSDLKSEAVNGERRVVVFKAQPIGDQIIPDLRIIATEPIQTLYTDESIQPASSKVKDIYQEAVGGLFEREAKMIVDGLLTSLPGGTIDQILIRLLQHKASILIVPAKVHGGEL